MDGIWQSSRQDFGLGWFTAGPMVLSQAPPPAPGANNALASPANQFLAALGLTGLAPTILNLIGGILILIIGWIIAAGVAKIVKTLLEKTRVDDWLATRVTGQTERKIEVESVLSSVVFWVILLVAVVAFLDAIKLTTVSQPLNTFLSQVIGFLPKLGGAAVLVGVAWILATLAKTVVVRSARSFGLDQRVSQTPDDATAPPTETPFLLSETLGNALYWFVFLFFLPLVLSVLDLQGPLQPVQNLLNDILSALPRILKAVIIGAIGWLLARTVRGIVTNLLTATGVDRVGSQLGLRRTNGSQSLSWLLGTVVYVLILIPTAIAALDALQIPAISQPATAMLNQVLSVIPQVFTAALILAIAYVIGRFIADLVRNVLAGIGFDNLFYWLGLQSVPVVPPVAAATPPTPPPLPTSPPTPEPLARPALTRTPSEIAGVVVLVGIMLFATVAATNVLNIPAVTTIVSGLLVVFGQILAGLIVFAIGLYLANLVFNLITSSGTAQSRVLGQTARIAIIALVSAMALQQMGIATNIVNLAFGLLLGAVAVAIALSFGLGCRGIAANQVEQWLAAFKR